MRCPEGWPAEVSWETVESLPNEPRAAADAGPFRAQSEPVQATRSAPSLRERMRLSFGSTPELPSARAGHEVVLTERYVYVRRADGTRARVSREALSGRREERGRVVYGVTAAEDLALLVRAGCPVQAALDAQLNKDDVPIHVTTHVRAMLQVLLALVALGVFGHSLAFVQLGLFPGFKQLIAVGALLVLLHALFLRPVRARLDRVGLHRRFGLLSLFHEQLPPEAFTGVRVLSAYGVMGLLHRHVQLHRKKGRPVTLRAIPDPTIGVQGPLEEATAQGALAASILGVPVLPHAWGAKR